MPTVHRAQWVLPIDAPPIRDGWVSVANGRIVALGQSVDRGLTPSDARGLTPIQAQSVPARVILPGLVNAHTHLELSWMQGQVTKGDAMPAWAARLMGIRRAGGGDLEAPIGEAIRAARASGTALVGDIGNSLAAVGPLADSELSAVVFHELIGFRSSSHAGAAEQTVRDAYARLAALTPGDALRAAVVPHAPYSVSPDLFRAIAAAAGDRPISVHLGESPEEIQFLRDGSGPWRSLLETVGAWDPAWTPPACGPVEYLDRLGLVNERLIAVHGTQLTDGELARLAAAGATLVACPRSNAWTGAGTPPVGRFYAAGVRVAIGTDSLASVDDLQMLQEAAAVRRLAPAVRAGAILRSATLDGARALGFERDLGSITPGKRAQLVAVSLQPDVQDVEEYLLSGIAPSQIQWLDDRDT